MPNHYTFETDELIIWMFEHGWSKERTAGALNVPVTTLTNWIQRRRNIPDTIKLLLDYIDLYGSWTPYLRPRQREARDRKTMKPVPKLHKRRIDQRKKPTKPYRCMDYWELNSWRGRLHLSGPKAAVHLRVNAHSMLRWQCNRSRIPSYIRRACNYIEKYGPLDLSGQPIWAHWVRGMQLSALRPLEDPIEKA